MRGIVIAAGAGMRMRGLTEQQPKCLLEIAGTTLLEHTLACMRRAGCSDIVVVTGHMAHAIRQPGIRTVHNAEFRQNNILHSLMYAQEYFDGPMIVSYSDIWVEPFVYETLMGRPGDIVLAVDRDWTAYYEGRTDHPVSEAENVHYRDDQTVAAFGKHLDAIAPQGLHCGEFLGLWRLSAAGTSLFREHFERLNRSLDREQPFQKAAKWRLAYISDFVQDLVDAGHRVECALVERGWAELDTEQDYGRLSDIAGQQKLETIAAYNAGRRKE